MTMGVTLKATEKYSSDQKEMPHHQEIVTYSPCLLKTLNTYTGITNMQTVWNASYR